jgi:hypothetical protein
VDSESAAAPAAAAAAAAAARDDGKICSVLHSAGVMPRGAKVPCLLEYLMMMMMMVVVVMMMMTMPCLPTFRLILRAP